MRKEYQIPQREERIFEPMLFKDYLKSKLISLLDSVWLFINVDTWQKAAYVRACC